jgi:general stress protein 26
MSSAQRLLKVLIQAFLLVSLAAATNAGGQQRLPKNLERQSAISVAREIIETARYCALITLDSAGRAQARTMDPFPPDERMVVWLATNPRSRKVAEIRRNRRVTLYYFDREGQAYVTIYGIARLVNDPKEKARRWKDEWKMFYPDRGKSYLLIAVTPQRLEVVSEKRGIVGDPKTWAPSVITFTSK